MFFQGDLQTGIGKAVQEDKLVVCFVTDNSEESSIWENDFLQEDSLRSSLINKTILLRLQAGSQEASYLAAIFPLPKTPVLVIIKNGELKEYLAPGVSKEEFRRRMGAVLGLEVSSQPAASEPPASQPSESRHEQPSTSNMNSESNSVAQDRPNNEQLSRDAQILSERSARLEAQKKAQDAKEKAKRAEEAKARREAAEQAAVPGSKAAESAKYASMQKKRQQEAREDRARILKRVEDDKAARREQEALRKAEAKARAEGVAAPSGTSSINPPLANKSAECAIQVRLFDGSTIRSRFSSQGTLRKDVRPWIDEKKGEDTTPFTFKQILPNKNIETSEEEQTLQSIGLTPSATLIIVPVKNATNAYEGNSGLVSRGVSTGYGIVSSGLGTLTGLLGSFLGAAPARSANEDSHLNVSEAPSARNTVQTLRGQNTNRDDQQFYNGNSTNFEPRRDDEDKKDD